MHDDVMLNGVLLEFVHGLLLGNYGYQTNRKEDLWQEPMGLFMAKAKSHSA